MRSKFLQSPQNPLSAPHPLCAISDGIRIIPVEKDAKLLQILIVMNRITPFYLNLKYLIS